MIVAATLPQSESDFTITSHLQAFDIKDPSFLEQWHRISRRARLDLADYRTNRRIASWMHYEMYVVRHYHVRKQLETVLRSSRLEVLEKGFDYTVVGQKRKPLMTYDRRK